jgi:hypothetical protein
MNFQFSYLQGITGLPGKCLFVLLIVACSARVAAFEVSNSEYGFRVQVPDRFETFDYLSLLRGGARKFVEERALHVYRVKPGESDQRFMHLYIEKSPYLMAIGINPNDNRSVLENAWNGMDIYLYRHEDSFQNGKPLRVTLNAVVPIKAGPIQLKVSGSPEVEAEMVATLRAMLETLQADSGLLTFVIKYKYPLVLSGVFAGFVYWKRGAA